MSGILGLDKNPNTTPARDVPEWERTVEQYLNTIRGPVDNGDAGLYGQQYLQNPYGVTTANVNDPSLRRQIAQGQGVTDFNSTFKVAPFRENFSPLDAAVFSAMLAFGGGAVGAAGAAGSGGGTVGGGANAVNSFDSGAMQQILNRGAYSMPGASGSVIGASPWAAPQGGGMSGVFDLLGSGGADALAGGATDMTGFMGNGTLDAWGAGNNALGTGGSLYDLAGQQLGGAGVNYGTGLGAGGYDPYGMGWSAPTATGSSGWDAVFNQGANLSQGGPWNDFSANLYGSGAGGSNWLQQALQAGKSLLGGNGGATGARGSGQGAQGAGGGLLGNLFNPDGSINWGGVGSAAGGMLPGAAALAYANSQPGIDVGPLQGIMGQFGGLNTNSQQDVLSRMQAANPGADLQSVLARMQGSDPASDLRGVLSQAQANAPLFVQAAQDPVQRNIAAGYGALQQSQGLRGLGGSSFGDTSLANYMDQGNRTLANAGTSAAQAALGLQGQIGGQIGQLTNQNLANQGQVGAQIGSLQNTNLGQQGTLSSGIYNQQLASILGQGSMANNLITQQNQAQKNKNDLFGRAFSGFGRGLSPNALGGYS